MYGNWSGESLIKRGPFDFREVYKRELYVYKLYCDACRSGRFIPSLGLEQHYYCWEGFVEVSAEVYKKISDLCHKFGIRHVYDIGCAFPFQANLFWYWGIAYTGIDDSKRTVDNANTIHRIHTLYGKYPFKIQTDFKSCAISNLCVGYQANSDKVYQQIVEDFPYYCGVLNGRSKEMLLPYYRVVETDFIIEKKKLVLSSTPDSIVFMERR